TLLFASFLLGSGLGALEDLAFVDPNLDANLAVGGVGFSKPVVDVGAQGLQGDGTFVVAFDAGDVGAGQTAGAGDLDALGRHAAARLHGVADGLLHRTAESDAALKLGSDVLSDELGVGG